MGRPRRRRRHRRHFHLACLHEEEIRLRGRLRLPGSPEAGDAAYQAVKPVTVAALSFFTTAQTSRTALR